MCCPCVVIFEFFFFYLRGNSFLTLVLEDERVGHWCCRGAQIRARSITPLPNSKLASLAFLHAIIQTQTFGTRRFAKTADLVLERSVFLDMGGGGGFFLRAGPSGLRTELRGVRSCC